MPSQDLFERRRKAAERSRVEVAERNSDSGGGGLQGLTDMVQGLGPGLLSFGGELLETGHGLLQIPGTAIAAGAGVDPEDLRDDPVSRLFVNADVVERSRDSNVSLGDALEENIADMVPVVDTTARSVVGTGGRLANTAAQVVNTPIEHSVLRDVVPGEQTLADNAYVEAWQEGRFVPLAVEDLGNAALVGGFAAKGLSGAAKSAAGGQARAAAAATGDDVAVAAAAPRNAVDGVLGDALAPHAGRLQAASRRVGDASVVADRIASPVTYPKLVATPALRRLAPGFAEEAAQQGSILLAGLRRTPAGGWFDDMRTRADVRNDALLTTADVQDQYAAQDLARLGGRERLVADAPEQRAAAAVIQGDAQLMLPTLRRLADETDGRLSAIDADPELDAGAKAEQRQAVLSEFEADTGLRPDDVRMLDDYYTQRDAAQQPRDEYGPVEQPVLATVDQEVGRLLPTLQREAADRAAMFGESKAAPVGYDELGDVTMDDYRAASQTLADPDASPVDKEQARAVQSKVTRQQEQGTAPMDAYLYRDAARPKSNRSTLSDEAKTDLAELHKEAAANDWEFDPLDGIADPDVDQAAWNDRLGQVLDRERQFNPAYAPPKQRQKILAVNRMRDRLTAELGDADDATRRVLEGELAAMPDAALDEIVDATRFDPDVAAQLPGQGRSGGGRLVGDAVRSRKVGAEYQKQSGDVSYQLPDVIRQVEMRRRVKAHNEAVREAARKWGVVEGETTPDGVEFTDEWARTQIDPSTGEPYGGLRDWARKNDMVEIKLGEIGERFREYVDDPDMQQIADAFDVDSTPDSNLPGRVFVPEPVKKGLDDLLPPPPAKGVGKAVDKFMSGWKTAVLPLMPRWYIANVTGNVFMATVGTDLSLADLWRDRKRFKAELDDAMTAPRDQYEARLLGTSSAREVLRDTRKDALLDPTMVGDAPKRGRVRRGFNKTVDKGYEANQWVDNATHIAIHVGKKLQRDRTMRQLDADLDAGRIDRAEYDRVAGQQLSDQEIMEEALRVAGDFRSMPSYQHTVLRRIFPFVAWYKHITKFALRLPVDSPYRAAWMFTLAGMFDDPENRPGWAKSMFTFGVGDTEYGLNVGSFVPLAGGAPGDSGSPLLSFGGAMGAANPIFQGAASLSGLNTQQGRLTTYAPGYGPRDNQGRQVFGMLDPGELLSADGAKAAAYQLAALTPPTRIARDMALEPVARYDSGQPILRGSQPYPSTRVGGQFGAPLLSAFGASLDRPDFDRSLRTERERRRQDEASRRRYDRRRQVAGV